jgi:hypothetical protein
MFVNLEAARSASLQRYSNGAARRAAPPAPRVLRRPALCASEPPWVTLSVAQKWNNVAVSKGNVQATSTQRQFS